MSIFITGITGYLGTHLVKEIRKRYPKKEIKALILPAEKEKSKEFADLNVEFVYGNLDSKNDLLGCLDNIDSVFHIAAVVDDLSPMSSFYSINHTGTVNLLDEFVSAGSKNFIYASTAGVYGFDLPDYPIDESYRVDLIPGYRESKYLGEQEVFKYAKKYGFKGSALRPPIIFGPGDHWAPTIFNLVESKRKIPFISKGEVVYSYSYVEDVIETLIKMDESDKSDGEIFNHNSYLIERRELFETAARICKVDLKIFNLNYSIAMLIGFFGEVQWKLLKKRPLLDRYRVKQMGKARLLSNRKIEELLEITPKKSFEEALTETYNWYSKNIKNKKHNF
jgi:nucleoside-diphosphate-sugar epimerase